MPWYLATKIGPEIIAISGPYLSKAEADNQLPAARRIIGLLAASKAERATWLAVETDKEVCPLLQAAGFQLPLSRDCIECALRQN